MFHHYGNATDSPAFARNFLIKRYARLFPVYALAFTVWHLALWWIHGQAYSTTPAEAIVNISLLFALTPTLSAGPTPASWSIGVEMLFYIAFIALARLSKRLPFLIGLLCLCYAISFQFSSGLVGKELPNQWYHAINPVLYLPCFIWGPIILCATKIKRVEGRAFALLAAAAALAFMVMLGWLAQIKDDVFGREPPLQYWVRVQLITLAFLPVIFVSACAPSVLIVNKVTVYLGRISYSLYLLHPIIIYFLGTRLLEVDLPGMAEPNLRFLVLAGILLAFTIVCAELSYRMIEMPGIALGRRLLGALNARGNSVPSNDRNELIPFHFPGTNERPKSI
jgi:peptidoglycan/LPS O-acetylase OafA/YrhL